jgi:hypothetical protein
MLLSLIASVSVSVVSLANLVICSNMSNSFCWIFLDLREASECSVCLSVANYTTQFEIDKTRA